MYRSVMNGRLKLAYWDSNNFGDLLSPHLINELSGIIVQHKDILNRDLMTKVKYILKGILYGDLEWWRKIFHSGEETIIAIGSIISWANKDSVIWGAGFMNESEDFNGCRVNAVRGPLTAYRLKQMGNDDCTVYGDPALLLPLWIKPVKKNKYKISLIPHWKEVDYFIERYSKKYHIIDLRTRDILNVLEQITSSQYILSTSLHGLIVPHAYGIPAIWIKKGYIDTDGFKFRDYFGSVNIPEYEGYSNIDDILFNESSWTDFFNANVEKSTIGVSLLEIQKELLRVAPFPLKQKYKNLIF